MNLGKEGEELAAKYYKQQGYKVLERNYIFPRGKQVGELDLVVLGRELVFVEVKTRKSHLFGTAAEAVTFSKQRKLVKTAKLFIQQHPQYQNINYRIDVAIVDVDNLAKPVIIITNAIEDLD